MDESRMNYRLARRKKEFAIGRMRLQRQMGYNSAEKRAAEAEKARQAARQAQERAIRARNLSLHHASPNSGRRAWLFWLVMAAIAAAAWLLLRK